MFHRTTLSLATAATLPLLAGTTLAQQSETSPSPHEAVDVAQSAGALRTTLADAVEMAQEHSGGVAIASRIVVNADWTDRHGMRDGLGQNERSGDEQRDRSDDEEHVDAVHAVVTCVLDRSRVRDVIVNLRTSKVVGMRTYRPGERSSRWTNDPRRDRDRDASSDRDQYRDTDRSRDADREMPRTRFVLLRASDLMHASVRNARGDELGELDDLAIDPRNGTVLYGVLKRGGFLGVGDSRYAIPMQELTDMDDEIVRLDVQEEDFENVEGFDDEWPRKANSRWLTKAARSSTTLPTANVILKGSTLVGSEIAGIADEDLGTIRDLVIDPRTQRIRYVVVEHEDEMYPVPMGACTIDDEGGRIPLTGRALRGMPYMVEGAEQRWDRPRWHRRIHEAYNVEPTWLRDAERDARDSDEQRKRSGRGG